MSNWLIDCRELNGVTVCFKMGNVQDSQQATSPQDNTNGRTAPHVPPRPFQPSSGGGGSPLYPPLGDGEQDYVILKPGPPAGPSRPAPRPPVVHQNSTLSASQNYGLDGVPFIINPKFINSKTADLVCILLFLEYIFSWKFWFYSFNFPWLNQSRCNK